VPISSSVIRPSEPRSESTPGGGGLSDGTGVAEAAGLGVGGNGGKVGEAVGSAPSASDGEGLAAGAPRATPPTNAVTRTTGTTRPATAMTRLRGAIACQEVRMPDMAGPYQTSPKCTLVQKYRDVHDPGAAYTDGHRGAVWRRPSP